MACESQESTGAWVAVWATSTLSFGPLTNKHDYCLALIRIVNKNDAGDRCLVCICRRGVGQVLAEIPEILAQLAGPQETKATKTLQ